MKKSLIVKKNILVSLAIYLFSVMILFLISLQINNNLKSAAISNNITQKISETVIEKTFNFLLPAMLISETSSNLMQSGVLGPEQTDLIEKSSLNFLKPHPQLSNFYFADTQGNFVMVFWFLGVIL